MGGCASRPKDLDSTRQDPLLLPQDSVKPEAPIETTSIQNDDNVEKVANEEPLIDVSEEVETIHTEKEDVEEKKPASEEEKVEAITVHEPETNVTATTDIIVKANEEETKDVPIVSV